MKITSEATIAKIEIHILAIADSTRKVLATIITMSNTQDNIAVYGTPTLFPEALQVTVAHPMNNLRDNDIPCSPQ